MWKIFDRDNWREIVATLGRNKTRTFLTGFGIFWGTAMLAMLLGGTGGLRGIIGRNFEGFATNMIAMFPDRTTVSYKGFNKGMSWSLKQADIDAMKKLPHVETSTPQFFENGNLTYRDKSRASSIIGATPDLFKIQLPNVEEGRLFNEQDDAQGAKVALIGKDVASEFFGTESAVGKYVNAGGVYVQIIGVISQKNEANVGARFDESIVMPENTMRRAYALGDKIPFFMLTLEEGHRLDEIKEDIYRIICANHPIAPGDESALVIIDISEMFKRVEGVFTAITLLAAFVGFGTLIAGIIGVGNIMWIIVKERTQEIGIRRAIGAHPSDIIMQVLSEGTVLTLVAGLAGISLGTIVLAIADKAFTAPGFGAPGFTLSFGTAVLILAVFMVFGCLAGLIPALKAMRIKPIEALNDK